MLVQAELLYATLAFTLISFIAVLYVILRTLAPLVPPHALSRWSRDNTPLPMYGYAQPEKQAARRKRLKSAQRFQCWLAFIDLSAVAIWLWEIVALATDPDARNSPARVAFAVCARPTVLLVVSLLSYFNVVRGKVIDLGRFDIIVWIPSLTLLAILVALSYVATASSAVVWEVMLSVQSLLFCICIWCFGRLLLAVFRVRRATIRNQTLRTRGFFDEKKTPMLASSNKENVAGDMVPIAQDGNDWQAIDLDSRVGESPPILPPIKTNRWLISKTFLMAKASSAANTVSASLHRRSASGPHGPRPSLASERYPRPSISTFSDPGDTSTGAPLGFLRHDPATTSRFGQIGSQSQATLAVPTTQPPDQIQSPRSITFSPDALSDVRMDGAIATPGDRSRMLSRTTDRSRLSGDEPRPSMGSYLSTTSVSDGRSSSDAGHVGSYLSSANLYTYSSTNHDPRHNNHHAANLTRKEARKAGARMGGHLVSCIATWMLVIPFLAYKIHDPARQAPWFTALLVALGVCLGGPLLAIQTWIAEGFWFKRDLPPLMASSSAVAFEHLASRATTPYPVSPITIASPRPDDATRPSRDMMRSLSPLPRANPAAAIQASAHLQIAPNTVQVVASSGNTQHRSNASTDSSSSSSLASIAAFSHPPQGMVRHSLDTQEAPSNIFARALHMAAPHPKLQVIGRGAGGTTHAKDNAVVDAQEDTQWKHDEARKLRSFTMARRRSNTVDRIFQPSSAVLDDALKRNETTTSRRSGLSIKDINALTQNMLEEAKQKRPRSPVQSITGRSISVYSTASETSRHDRRQSAPVTPSSQDSKTSSGVLISRPVTVDMSVDADMRSALAKVEEGALVIEHSSITAPPSTAKSTSTPSKHRRKPPNLNLSLKDIASHFTSFDKAGDVQPLSSITSGFKYGSNSKQRHLRRRSHATSISVNPEETVVYVDDTYVTKRHSRPQVKTSTSTESASAECTIIGPRQSLEQPVENADGCPDERQEVLSEGPSTILVSPNTPSAMPDSATLDPSMLGHRRPSIILLSTPSTQLQPQQLAESDEVGTIFMAQRVARAPSRISKTSDILLHRSASTRSDAGSTHSRGSSTSSVTSPGFLNMINSNRNSWTDALPADSSSFADNIENISPPRFRNGNVQSMNTFKDHEKSDKTEQKSMNQRWPNQQIGLQGAAVHSTRPQQPSTQTTTTNPKRNSVMSFR